MSAQIFYNNGSSSSEIITHLVNASDGAGLHFNGTSGYIDIASPPDLGTAFSFEFIIQADLVTTTTETMFVDFGTGGRFSFGINHGDNTLSIFDGTSWKTFGVLLLDDLKVHHLVMTVDSTSAIAYDNGNQVGTATISASHGIDSCTDAKIGSRFGGSSNFFNGTIYRARFWNKTLSSADVTSVYESASIDFADQYGSQTIVIPGDFNGNLDGWDASNNWNSQTNPSNNMVLAASAADQICRTSITLTKGKRYRCTYTASGLTGSPQFANYTTAIPTDSGSTTITAGTNSFEFVFQAAYNSYFYIRATGATDAVTLDDVSVVEVGAVADFDLAYANPTQSTIVQNRSGSGDGTAAGGVSQITKLEAVNTNKLNVGGTTPLVGIGVPPGSTPTVPLEVYGNIRAQVSDAGGFYLTNNTGVVRNNSTGVAVRTAGADRLVVDTAGAVTMASDCADSPGSGNVAPLILGGATDGNKRLLLGFNTTANQGFIQAVNHTVAYSDLVLQPAGGNVGLGESAPTNLLTLKPAIQSRQAIKFTVGTTTVSGGYIGDGGESENLWITAGGEVTATTASANGFTARNNEGGGAGKAAAIRVGDGAGTIKFYTASGLTNGNTFTLDGGSETGLALAISNAGLATFSAGINVSAGDLGVGTTNPDAGTNAPTSRSSVGKLNTYTGVTAEIADSGTLDIALTMAKGLMAYLVESNGNSNYMSAGFFRSNNNGASSSFTLFGQSENSVAVTIPSAGNIRITNNSGAAVTFFYAITVIAG